MQLIEQQQLICQVTLPLPPGINATYKRVTYKKRDALGTVKTIHGLGSTDKAQSFKQHASLTLHQQMATADKTLIERIKQSKEKIPLALELDFCYSTLWLHDIDSGIKAVQDVLFKHLGINDNQVVRLLVEKHADRSNPRVEVELYLAGETW